MSDQPDAISADDQRMLESVPDFRLRSALHDSQDECNRLRIRLFNTLGELAEQMKRVDQAHAREAEALAKLDDARLRHSGIDSVMKRTMDTMANELIANDARMQAMRAKVRRYQEVMRWVGEGISDVQWPTENGTRDWISEWSIYLRGDAAALLQMDPTHMRCLLAAITEARNEQ